MTKTGANRKRESVIDENLKRVYQETMEEGVPDRFKELLKALKSQESEKGSGK